MIALPPCPTHTHTHIHTHTHTHTHYTALSFRSEPLLYKSIGGCIIPPPCIADLPLPLLYPGLDMLQEIFSFPRSISRIREEGGCLTGSHYDEIHPPHPQCSHSLTMHIGRIRIWIRGNASYGKYTKDLSNMETWICSVNVSMAFLIMKGSCSQQACMKANKFGCAEVYIRLLNMIYF
jgi:hypothetical protein